MASKESYPIYKGRDGQETCIKSIEAPLVSTEEIWFSPNKNWFRLNSDAAINEVDSLAGLGVVIRNSKGEFTAASSSRIPFFGDIEFAEASVILEGVKLGRGVGAYTTRGRVRFTQCN